MSRNYGTFLRGPTLGPLVFQLPSREIGLADQLSF